MKSGVIWLAVWGQSLYQAAGAAEGESHESKWSDFASSGGTDSKRAEKRAACFRFQKHGADIEGEHLHAVQSVEFSDRAALALVGAWTNMVFILIILLNLVIGIAQELHAKKMVDELSLLIVPKAKVIRDGQEQSIPVEDVVLDDVMVLDSGQQICCDSVVIEGESEVNESLLTGESDPVNKKREILCFRAPASSPGAAWPGSSMWEKRIMCLV